MNAIILKLLNFLSLYKIYGRILPMKITVNRIASNSDATLSYIYIDDKFECFGLEDEYREEKIASETRIPEGTYDIGVRKEGGFSARYFKKFNFHAGMLQVLDVPNFEYILIHIGNTEKDTAGCLLVGAGANTNKELTISSSRIAYEQLYKKAIQSAVNGNLTITYKDLDNGKFL